MKSNDRLCVFTAEGNMYQVKAAQIPKGKIRDKGTLIHQMIRLGKEEIVLYTGFEELFECSLLFVTEGGYVKIVSGIEFDTARLQVMATKLDDGDKVVNIVKLTATDILSENRKVIMMTNSGLSLCYALEEVSEFKKTSRGVKGIILEKNDKVALGTVVSPADESFEFKGKEIPVKKIKIRKRGLKGMKTSL